METPLVKSPELTEKYKNNIYLKLEYLHPTGTHKDRESLSILKDVISKGLNQVGCASTGNAALSLAYTSLQKGLKCHIWLNKDLEEEKLNLIKKFRPEIHFVEGSYKEILNTSNIYMKNRTDIYNANPGVCDIRMQGDKEIASEIKKHISPDYVLVPANNGTLLAGISKGFQSESVCMVGATSKDGKIASSISGLCLSDLNHVEKIPNYQLVDLNDEEIITAFRELVQAGFFVEPSSASTLAALKKLNIQDKNICLILTASGIRNCSKPDLLFP